MIELGGFVDVCLPLWLAINSAKTVRHILNGSLLCIIHRTQNVDLVSCWLHVSVDWMLRVVNWKLLSLLYSAPCMSPATQWNIDKGSWIPTYYYWKHFKRNAAQTWYIVSVYCISQFGWLNFDSMAAGTLGFFFSFGYIGGMLFWHAYPMHLFALCCIAPLHAVSRINSLRLIFTLLFGCYSFAFFPFIEENFKIDSLLKHTTMNTNEIVWDGSADKLSAVACVAWVKCVVSPLIALENSLCECLVYSIHSLTRSILFIVLPLLFFARRFCIDDVHWI